MGDLHYLHDPRSDLERCFAPPWFEDVYALARLWRFLLLTDQRPHDPAHFMTHALEYREAYEAMCECEFPSLSEP